MYIPFLVEQYLVTWLYVFFTCSTSEHSRLCLNDFSGLFSLYFSLYMILFFEILSFDLTFAPPQYCTSEVGKPFHRGPCGCSFLTQIS